MHEREESVVVGEGVRVSAVANRDERDKREKREVPPAPSFDLDDGVSVLPNSVLSVIGEMFVAADTSEGKAAIVESLDKVAARLRRDLAKAASIDKPQADPLPALKALANSVEARHPFDRAALQATLSSAVGHRFDSPEPMREFANAVNELLQRSDSELVAPDGTAAHLTVETTQLSFRFSRLTRSGVSGRSRTVPPLQLRPRA